MAVNSISHAQPAQQTQAERKTEVATARKQSDVQEANKVKDRRDAAEHNAQVQKAQLQKTQESARPTVNTSGHKVGTVINTSA